MVLIKIQDRELKIEKVKSVCSLLKKLNLIPECSIVLKDGKIMDPEEKLKEEDKVEIVVFGWEDL